MSVADIIYSKISKTYKPKLLEIVDESNDHAGHGGWRESGETHFKVILSKEPFEGMSKIARNRALYKLLEDEQGDGGIHALGFEFKDAQ